MYYSFKNISDRIQLQPVINIFQSWSNTWQLNVATNKCAVMTIGKICPASFSIDNSLLPNVINILVFHLIILFHLIIISP